MPTESTDNFHKVVVGLTANNHYIPYISVLLHSIASHASDNRDYEFIIFNQDISKDSMQSLCSEFVHKTNFEIRFLDMSSRLDEYKDLFTHGHFATETYFRLFFSEVLAEYDKVLHLDGDMIIKADIAELFDVDVEDCLLAACLDPDTAGLYNGYLPEKKEYIDSVLRIQNPYEYFQAGVVLFNLAEMRNSYSISELLSFASSYPWQLLDQDVLNYFAQGRVKFVDMSWNVLHDWDGVRVEHIIARAPEHLVRAYQNARIAPKIVHYAGPEKPWQIADCDFAQLFWFHARKSIYYELILSRLCVFSAQRAVLNDPDYVNLVFKELLNQLESYKHEQKMSFKLKKVIRTIVHRTCPEGTRRRRILAAMKERI